MMEVRSNKNHWIEIGAIKAIVREVSTPNKSLQLEVADFILRPLNVALELRKIVDIGPNEPWVKEERTQNRALLILSYLGTVIFAPLIMTVLYLKSQSYDQKLLIGTHKFNKLNAHFKDRVQKVDRNNPLQGFSFDLIGKNGTKTQTVSFTWYGKLKETKELL